jgi:sugar fermentation stimulation protein A
VELPSLTPGTIVRRYKRFLADVILEDGREITAHCPNTGAMTGCWAPGAPVELSYSTNPKRKYAWTLERVDVGGGWIGVNTTRVNSIVAEAIREGTIETLTGYASTRSEPRIQLADYPGARLDFLLTGQGRPDTYVEVKNTTLLLDDRLCFPDAVTDRGRKHLDLLMALVSAGCRGVVIFALNRSEGAAFAPAAHIDPEYANRLREVAKHGVEVISARLQHDRTSVTVSEVTPWHPD